MFLARIKEMPTISPLLHCSALEVGNRKDSSTDFQIEQLIMHEARPTQLVPRSADHSGSKYGVRPVAHVQNGGIRVKMHGYLYYW